MEVCMRCGSAREGLEVKCKNCSGPFEYVVDFPFNKQIKLNFPYVKEWVELGEFNTPIIRKGNVWFKLDSLNPTGSYKDRGAVTMVSYLVSKGVKELSEDSSGNAGAAIAAYSAAAGIKASIYVPETVSGVKLRQAELFGARVFRVAGSRQRVAEAAESSGFYYASHVLEPHFRDGIRSLAYEIVADLGWEQPDHVFVPTSAGSLLLGLHSGFRHLLENGVIEKIPNIVAVQTEQVKPVYCALKGMDYSPPTRISSVADALISTNPFLLPEMVKVLRENGDSVLVSESEILTAKAELAHMGVLVENSSATVYAAYKKIKPYGKVVLHITGNGLKNV